MTQIRMGLTTIVATFSVLLAPSFITPPPAHASDCVSRVEFRSAKTAWQMEGLTRAGVRARFGWDGARAWQRDGVLKRRYTGCRPDVRVLVKYRHFPEAPGPTRVWWVVRMWRVVD